MPHLIIEHSSNVADVADIAGLVEAVHEAALETGVAPLDALRTRAVPCAHFAIGDQHPDNKFIAITARLGAGRSGDDRRMFIQALMNALDDFLGDARQTMMLSVECQEIDPASRINANNLRTTIAARAGDAHPT